MEERDQTTDEVLLKPLKRPLKSLDELLDRCWPTLAARLWTTCCWPASMSDGWKIGDYNFLILSTFPEKEAQIYLQFWSEPGEQVLAEVSSGEWSPGTVKYVRQHQKQFLTELGFSIGGVAKNFQKEIVIESSGQAEAAARETLRILYDGFGYRGQWPLALRCTQGERADLKPTYESVTPEDFAKLLEEAGFRTTIPAQGQPEDVRLVVFRRGHRTSLAIFADRVHRNNLYSLITFQTSISTRASNESLQELNETMRFLKVRRRQQGGVIAETSLGLSGGVTTGWLNVSFAQWIQGCRHAERFLQKAALRGKKPTRSGKGRVH